MNRKSLKEKWEDILFNLSSQFADGEKLGVEGVLFLIGVQELGEGYRNFSKEEKQDILHIALCTILEPFGYYVYEGVDEQGWPHFSNTKRLPTLKRGEQTRLMKEAIVLYFEKEGSG